MTCRIISTFFFFLALPGFAPSYAEDLPQIPASSQQASPENAPPENTAEEHLRLGVDFYLSDELEVAIDEFREAARHRPDYADAYHNLGVALAKTGNLTGALAAWSQADRLDFQPGSLRYHLSSLISYNYGISLVRDGRLEQAMEQWQAALRIQPDFSEAYYALGMGFLAAGNPVPAVAHFQHALEHHPEQPKIFEALGYAYYDSHEFGRAEEVWRQALTLTPDLPKVQANLALLRLQEGNFQDAINNARAAVALQPDLEAAHFNLGVALLAKGDESASLQYLETALRLNSRSSSTRLLLGVIWSRWGNWARAASVWREALRQDVFAPDEVWLHFNLGLAMAALGYEDQTIAEFQQVVGLRPKWAPGWSQLGMAHLAKRQWEKGISALETAAKLQPSWAHLYFVMGKAHVEQGNWPQAITPFQRAVESEPGLVEGWFYLGVVFRALNRSREAVEPLQRAAEGGSGEAQNLLAAMYANGSGVKRNLALAIWWWFQSSRMSMAGDLKRIANEQLSHLRKNFYRDRLTFDDRQEVVSGFNRVRQELYRQAPIQQTSIKAIGEKKLWDNLIPTNRVLTWVIEQALALNPLAQRTLDAWYRDRESDSLKSAEARIREYFVQTAKEGNPFSCGIIQSMTAGSPTADLPAWQLVQQDCPKRPKEPELSSQAG